MLRSWLLTAAVVMGAAPGACACDALVAVAPSVVFEQEVGAPLELSVAPTAVVVPLAIDADALRLIAAPTRVRVRSAAPACAGARIRAFARPARPRVVVRVR